MQIKKLNEEIENLLKENTEDEYAISDAEKAELWDMVKDFDEYISGNSINEENLNEVLKTDCGLELQLATIDLIPNREKYKLLPYSMSFTKENRLSWLVDYVNKAKIQDIIGLKISDVGTINYRLDKQNCSKKFIIPVGMCSSTTTNLVENAAELFGLIHMKYGDSGHWDESLVALAEVPQIFKNPIWVYPSKKLGFKYNYVFYSKSGHRYAFGVPRDKYSETILITCF